MSLLKKNHELNYFLCLSKNARQLFQVSLKTLIESENSDFMVYKLQSRSKVNIPDYKEWLEIVEIDEGKYSLLHLNLCHKIGKKVRRKNC